MKPAPDDDFNTADAISVIFDLVRFSNSNADEHSSRAFLEALKKEIMTLADVCGLIVERKQDPDAEIEQLIADRQQARKDKNFARADEPVMNCWIRESCWKIPAE